jgi:hypothetical protein
MASNNTENVHHKFIAKYNALRDALNYLRYVTDKFISLASPRVLQVRRDLCTPVYHALDGVSLRVEDSFMKYQTYSMACLSDHYKVCADSREDMRTVYSRYQKIICSNNMLDEVNHILRDVRDVHADIASLRGFKTFVKNETTLNADLYDHAEHSASETAETDVVDIIADMKSFLIDAENACLDNGPNVHVSAVDLICVNANVMSRLGFEEAINRIYTAFNDQKIVFTPEKSNPNRCTCGRDMILYVEDAELRCDECGRVVLLQGTVYDDAQSETSSGVQSTKNKRYDPKRHCDKRLMQIQAKEEWKIAEDVISRLDKRAVREYRYGNGLRSMNQMACRQIRRWLKEEHLTKHNHHAPYLRKVITSMHGIPVIPPQLTPEEEQEVLIDFSIAMSCYEKVTQTDEYRRKYEKDRGRSRQRTKPNRFYYWFVLFKILSQKLRGDPRLPRLLECIHLQSSATLAKDDDIWAMMCDCSEMSNYVAEHTDRGIAQINF